MSGRFGIDSAASAGGYYDRAVAAFGKPEFIGRYLNVYSLTAEERDFIHGKGCAILALWNRDQNGAAISSGNIQTGREEAAAACVAWAALGLPPGRAIYTDVENNMFLSGAALQGWIEGCHANGYVAGVYLNPPNGNNHTAGYQAARQATQGIPCVHFTSQHELYAYQDRPQHDFIVDGSHAAAVPGYESECVVWQSWEKSLGGTVDLDCASDAGFALMWGKPAPVPPKPPAPPTPTTKRVTVPGSLKVAPSHTSSVSIDPRGKPVYLERGAEVMPTGKVSGEWTEVLLAPPEHQVHGYFLTASLG